MKYSLTLILAAVSLIVEAQYADWTISTEDIDAASYFGVTVANGVTGLVSSPEPFKVKPFWKMFSLVLCFKSDSKVSLRNYLKMS